MKQENTPGKAMKSQDTERDGCHISGERWLMIVAGLVLGGYLPLDVLPNDARNVISEILDSGEIFMSEVNVRCGRMRDQKLVYTTTVDSINAIESVISKYSLDANSEWPLYVNATFCMSGGCDKPVARVNVRQKD